MNQPILTGSSNELVQLNTQIPDSDARLTVRKQDNEQNAKNFTQIFQCLHGPTTYEGAGIGVAICRKIAERHGATLTAQSQSEQGTTFTFTLPIIHHPSGAEHAN